MVAMNCRMDIPEVPGLPPSELTVGRIFDLTCTGEWPQDWTKSTRLEPVLEAEQKYSIKILSFEKLSDETYKFKLTSYQPGTWNFPEFKIKDGNQEILLGKVQFEVQSVLDRKESQQEPFGMIGPLGIPIPMGWWAIVIGILVSILLLGILEFRKRWQRKKLLASLKQHDSAVSPISEFHQNLRKIRRDHSLFNEKEVQSDEPVLVVQEIEKFFKLFILRRFRVPAYDWSDRVLLSVLKKENTGINPKIQLRMKKILNEFSIAKKEKKINSKDALQLTQEAQSLVEALEDSHGELK